MSSDSGVSVVSGGSGPSSREAREEPEQCLSPSERVRLSDEYH